MGARLQATSSERGELLARAGDKLLRELQSTESVDEAPPCIYLHIYLILRLSRRSLNLGSRHTAVQLGGSNSRRAHTRQHPEACFGLNLRNDNGIL